MAEFVFDNFFALGTLSITFFGIILYFIKKNIINIGDPLLQLILYGSISMATLLLVDPIGENGSYARIYFITSYICIFIMISLYQIGGGEQYNKEKKIILNSRDLLVIFLLSLTTGIIIMVNFVESGMAYEARALLFTKFRVIEILRGASTSLLAFSLGFVLDKKKVLIYILPIILLNFFTGSKGYLINIAANYVLGKGISGNLRLNFITLISLLVISYISVYLLFVIQMRENINQDIFYRILASGDIYFHSLQELDISYLEGIYNIFTYILHPITNIFGYRMYEFSLGNELQGQLSGDYESGGTNAGFLYLLYISFQDKYVSIILTLGWPLLFIFARKLVDRIIKKVKEKKYERYNIIYIAIIYNLITIPVLIFLDVGVGVQQLLGGFIILFLLFISKYINFFLKI